MLVICCGMMRSGSTLQYQIATELVEKAGKGIGLGEVRDADCRQLLDAKPENQMQVVKLHQLRHLKGVKEAIAQNQARCIYSYRDIRDVTYSLVRMRNSTFEKVIFQTQEIKECIDNFYAWTALDNVLISRYEDMIADLVNETLRISHHLGLACSLEDAQTIADQFNLKKQRSRIEQWQAAKQEGASGYEPKSMLHANHINSDRLQNASTKLSALQIAYLENMTETWLKSQNYTITSSSMMRKISDLSYLGYTITPKIQRVLKVDRLLPKN
jgi:Sulfotransferase domain